MLNYTIQIWYNMNTMKLLQVTNYPYYHQVKVKHLLVLNRFSEKAEATFCIN